ncbi:MAG: type VI secretion system needle protein Hcp [Prevotellaceae bacterium]|nr:type VI secretion system needle protein Hcp [Prevotellaceae bacterium]
MFGYKSVMYLGVLSNVSTDGMELNQFSYFFSQAKDEQGKPQGEVRAGTLQMTFANLPSADMLEWMVNPRKFKEGVVMTYDTENALLQKISFSSAACVGMKLHYEESGKCYCTTRLTLKAKKIVVAETIVENNWKNI